MWWLDERWCVVCRLDFLWVLLVVCSVSTLYISVRVDHVFFRWGNGGGVGWVMEVCLELYQIWGLKPRCVRRLIVFLFWLICRFRIFLVCLVSDFSSLCVRYPLFYWLDRMYVGCLVCVMQTWNCLCWIISRICSLNRVLKFRPVWPMYFMGQVSHFNWLTPFALYISSVGFFVLRWCFKVFVVLYAIFKLVFLNSFVIVLVSEQSMWM
jgi:hypothetical protein